MRQDGRIGDSASWCAEAGTMKIFSIFIAILLTTACANTHLVVRSTSTGDGGGFLGAALQKVALAATVPLAKGHSHSCDQRGGDEHRRFNGHIRESSQTGGNTQFVFRQDCRD